MKNLFLIAILFLSLTAFGQGVSVVRVVQLGADYAATPPRVEFRVYWDAAPDNINHLDSVWVFVDYQPISSTGTVGAWTPATLSTPATASAGTVIPVAGNTRGFYLRGTPAAGFSSTVTVELAGLVAGDKFNWCAYVSDYPPNATPGAGFYNLHGTPPFIINGSITEPTRQFSDCIDALTDATGCPGLIPAKPEITAFTPLFDTICEGETVTLSATATGAAEYSFDDGATWQAGNSASVAPTSDATYILKVRNAAGCTVTAAAVASIKVYPKPVATFSSAPAAACGGSSVTVVADGGSSYCFTHSCTACGRNPYRNGNDDPTDFDCRIGNDTCIYGTSNSYTFTMPDSGSVTVCVRMLTANGCADSICTTISAGTVTPPTPILAGAGTYCDNTVLNSYGVAGYSYQLQNILLQNEGLAQTGADAPLTFPITASGIYTLTVADAVTNCTTTSNAVEVTVNVSPAAPTMDGGGTQCGGSLNITATTGSGGNGIRWTDDDSTVSSRSVSSSGTYYAVTTSASGCESDTASVEVTIKPVPDAPTMDGGGTQCGGSLNITATTGSGGNGIRWTDDDSTVSSRSVSSSGTYYAVTTSASGCESDAVSVVATINPVPDVPDLSAPASVCAGSNLTFTASGGNGNYNWDGAVTGNGNNKTVGTSAGSYTARVRSFATFGAQTCYSSYTANVTGVIKAVGANGQSASPCNCVTGTSNCGGTCTTNGTYTTNDGMCIDCHTAYVRQRNQCGTIINYTYSTYYNSSCTDGCPTLDCASCLNMTTSIHKHAYLLYSPMPQLPGLSCWTRIQTREENSSSTSSCKVYEWTGSQWVLFNTGGCSVGADATYCGQYSE